MEGLYVDNTKELTHVGLCAGYGGIELGLKRVIPSLRTVALCEIEAFACANLVAKMEAGFMDPAPIWTNLKTFPWEEFCDRVDVLTGGYPCQPFSAAGQRKGADDPRHLWPFISAGIAAMRPRLCFFENVEGHISLGLPDVIEDLGRLGYRATWGIFSAAEVGAPHQRKRVFVLAHRKGEGLERYSGLFTGRGESRRNSSGSAGSTNGSSNVQDIWPSRPGEAQHAWEPPRVVGNAQRADAVGDDPGEGSGTRMEVGRDCVLHAGGDEKEQFTDASGAEPAMGDASLLNGSGQAGGQWEAQVGRADTARYDRQTQSALGGNADGAAGGLDYAELCDNRTDELRLLGNGVVPATAALAFQTLARELFL